MKKLLFLTITIGLFYGVSCFASGGYKIKSIANRNIDKATGDIAKTISGWIEAESYGWYAVNKAPSISSEFDSDVKRTGRLTLKLSTTDITGRNYTVWGASREPSTTEPLSSLTKYAIPIKSSNTYKINLYAKTNNVNTNAAKFGFRVYNNAGTRNDTVSSASNALSGTQDWTLLTKNFISGSSDAWLTIFPQIEVGNISDAWFDVNSIQITSVANYQSKVLNRY